MGAAAVIGAGALVSAYAASNAASDKQQALSDEARASEENAIMAQKSSQYNATKQQMQAGQQFGEMKVGYAASGVTADSGSVLDIFRQSHVNAEMDRQNILFGGDVQALNARNRADAARTGMGRAGTAGTIGVYSSLFSGANAVNANYGGGGRSASGYNSGLDS